MISNKAEKTDKEETTIEEKERVRITRNTTKLMVNLILKLLKKLKNSDIK